MKMTIALLALVVSAITAPLSQASNPSTVPDLLKNWGKVLNKPVIWEAGNDYDGRMVKLEQIDISQHGVFERAFDALNSVLENAREEPLKVCVFPNALVVRRVIQPACDKAI